ncbi:MAG: hypothetical protein AAB966_00700 [Patescibacteria group bacterium]
MGLVASSFPIPCDLCKTEYPSQPVTDCYRNKTNQMKLQREMEKFPDFTSSFARFRKLMPIYENNTGGRRHHHYDYRCDRCIGKIKWGWEYQKCGFIGVIY